MNEQIPGKGGSSNTFESIIETETYRRVRCAVADRVSPLLILSAAGMGKTTLLRLLERDWLAKGGHACFVQLAQISQDGDLFSALYKRLGHNESIPTTTQPFVVSSSAGELAQSVVALVDTADPPPLILLDGLDETFNVHPVLRIVRFLSERTRAIVVVTSRQEFAAYQDLDTISFHRITIPPLTDTDIQRLLTARGVSQDALRGSRQLSEMAGGSPLFAAMIADRFATHPLESLEDLGLSGAPGLKFHVQWAFDRDLARIGDVGRRSLLRTLALLAIRGPSTLSDLQLNDEAAQALATSALVYRRDDVFLLAHRAIESAVLAVADALPPPGTRIQDLEFGSEEAERDSLLAKSFIAPPGGRWPTCRPREHRSRRPWGWKKRIVRGANS